MSFFIKQLGDKDCGYTCVKMLMAMTYKNKDFLFYPEPSIDESASLKDLMMYAKKEGIQIGAYRLVDREELFTSKELKPPILIPIKQNNMLHMVLIKEIKHNKVKVYDPASEIYWMKKDVLFDLWNGEYLDVISVDKSDFALKKLRVVPRRMTFFSMFFELLSFASLMAALYFIDGNVTFYVSLGLFLSYIIFEFVYRKILISSLKYFDKHTMVEEFALNRQDFKSRFANMTQFKVLAISNPIQLLSLTLMTLFGVTILGINSPYNLISIAIIVLFEIGFKFYEKLNFSYKRNNLDQIEKDLSSTNRLSDSVFLEKINKLNTETYHYVAYCNFRKYVMVFLIIALSLIYVKLSDINSLNFMLFHFFFYLYISENIEKIINFSRNFEEYKHYKALYLYYFNKY